MGGPRRGIWEGVRTVRDSYVDCFFEEHVVCKAVACSREFGFVEVVILGVVEALLEWGGRGEVSFGFGFGKGDLGSLWGNGGGGCVRVR